MRETNVGQRLEMGSGENWLQLNTVVHSTSFGLDSASIGVSLDADTDPNMAAFSFGAGGNGAGYTEMTGFQDTEKTEVAVYFKPGLMGYLIDHREACWLKMSIGPYGYSPFRAGYEDQHDLDDPLLNVWLTCGDLGDDKVGFAESVFSIGEDVEVANAVWAGLEFDDVEDFRTIINHQWCVVFSQPRDSVSGDIEVKLGYVNGLGVSVDVFVGTISGDDAGVFATTFETQFNRMSGVSFEYTYMFKNSEAAPVRTQLSTTTPEAFVLYNNVEVLYHDHEPFQMTSQVLYGNDFYEELPIYSAGSVSVELDGSRLTMTIPYLTAAAAEQFRVIPRTLADSLEGNKFALYFDLNSGQVVSGLASINCYFYLSQAPIAIEEMEGEALSYSTVTVSLNQLTFLGAASTADVEGNNWEVSTSAYTYQLNDRYFIGFEVVNPESYIVTCGYIRNGVITALPPQLVEQLIIEGQPAIDLIATANYVTSPQLTLMSGDGEEGSPNLPLGSSVSLYLPLDQVDLYDSHTSLFGELGASDLGSDELRIMLRDKDKWIEINHPDDHVLVSELIEYDEAIIDVKFSGHLNNTQVPLRGIPDIYRRPKLTYIDDLLADTSASTLTNVTPLNAHRSLRRTRKVVYREMVDSGIIPNRAYYQPNPGGIVPTHSPDISLEVGANHPATLTALSGYQLFVVNGRIFIPRHIGDKAYLVGAARWLDATPDKQLAVIDFGELGGFIPVIITENMLELLGGPDEYPTVKITIPGTIGAKTVMMVSNGYLHLPGEDITITSPNSIVIRLNRLRCCALDSQSIPATINWVDRVAGPESAMDLSTFDPIKYLCNGNSAVILVNAPNVCKHVEPIHRAFLLRQHTHYRVPQGILRHTDGTIAHYRVTDYDDAQVAIMSTRPRLLHDVMLGADQSGVAFYGSVQLHEPNRFNEDLTSIDLYTI